MTETVIVDGYTRQEIDLIWRTVAAGATADELRRFLEFAKRKHLDPLAGQILFQTRGKGEDRKGTHIVSIDGYRAIAEESGRYAGSDDPAYRETQDSNLLSASVTVWKMVDHQRCPFTATAFWDEYAPKEGGFMWRKMPRAMLAKCAEALALRKAFPSDLGSLYVKEEMDQAEDPESKPPARVDSSTGEIVTPVAKPTNGTPKPVIQAFPDKVYICSTCKRPITAAPLNDTDRQNGIVRTADFIATATMRRFKKLLCAEHAAAEEASREEAKRTVLPPMADDDESELTMEQAQN